MGDRGAGGDGGDVYISDPDFSCGTGRDPSEVVQEVLADLKSRNAQEDSASGCYCPGDTAPIVV